MLETKAKATGKSEAKPEAAVTLAAAHARLAQWALTVYVGTAIVISALLVAALVTEMAHDEDQLENALHSAAIDRSYALRRYLDLLTAELSRLGARSEIQNEDNDDSPERKLLELSHKGSTLFDVGVAILFGFLGYIFLKLDCESAPLLLGYILGPLLEENLRRALVLSRGDYTVFATRPLSAAMLLMALGLLVLMVVPAIRAKREQVFQET